MVFELLGSAFVKQIAELIASSTISLLSSGNRRKQQNNAIFEALDQAVSEYRSLTATSIDRLPPVSDKRLFDELIKVLPFGNQYHRPNLQLIADIWRESIQTKHESEFPSYLDMKSEAKKFIGLFERSLGLSDEFRGAYTASNIADISDNLPDPLPGIQEEPTGAIPDYSNFILDKTEGFVGRDYLVDRIDAFSRNNPKGGYIRVTGDPGIGKTSFAAHLAQKFGYVHHFNILAEGANGPAALFRSLCAQLIRINQLQGSRFPPIDAGAEDLRRTLQEVHNKTRKPVFLVIDALDEMRKPAPGQNTGGLPSYFPEGTFFIVTHRRQDRNVRLRHEHAEEFLDISRDQAWNERDIRTYLEAACKRPQVARFLETNSSNPSTFVDELAEKSEGNFMYLKWVLADIEAGLYDASNINTLPRGLGGYFEGLWDRLQSDNHDDWLDFKLPVLAVLASHDGPISLRNILKFSGSLQPTDQPRLARLLSEDWNQYLYSPSITIDGKATDFYRLYHHSFKEFIASKKEVGAAIEIFERVIAAMLV